MAARLCAERGVQVPLLEHPEVPMGAARLQLHLMATYQSDQCLAAAACIAEAVNEAERYEELRPWHDDSAPTRRAHLSFCAKLPTV